ncbi:MAG: ribonuclease P protein component [Candidatus Hydrothermales bacterium]
METNSLDYKLPKRLKKDEIKEVFESGEFKRGNMITLVYKKGEGKVAFTSKKENLKAHDRNRIKRILREIFRKNRHLFKGFDVVLIGNSKILNTHINEVEKELRELWEK